MVAHGLYADRKTIEVWLLKSVRRAKIAMKAAQKYMKELKPLKNAYRDHELRPYGMGRLEELDRAFKDIENQLEVVLKAAEYALERPLDSLPKKVDDGTRVQDKKKSDLTLEDLDKYDFDANDD
jgi:GTP1/Obg family GTP-binding protein